MRNLIEIQQNKKSFASTSIENFQKIKIHKNEDN